MEMGGMRKERWNGEARFGFPWTHVRATVSCKPTLNNVRKISLEHAQKE